MIAIQPVSPIDTLTLSLSIRRTASRKGTAGEVTIENRSNDSVEVPVDVHPLQHLDLQVCDDNGQLVSQGWYGNRFSPCWPTRVLRLLPGESYTHTIFLVGTVPSEMRQPGQYTIRAIYEYPGLRAESEPLTITI